jgi:site-specific recombinase XerD
LEDLRAAERRVFIAKGKGGHERLVPISRRFFDHLAAYLKSERPPDVHTDRVFVVLKGPNRGKPLSAKGLDEVLVGARRRARLKHATCHEKPYVKPPSFRWPGRAEGRGVGRGRRERCLASSAR